MAQLDWRAAKHNQVEEAAEVECKFKSVNQKEVANGPKNALSKINLSWGSWLNSMRHLTAMGSFNFSFSALCGLSHLFTPADGFLF